MSRPLRITWILHTATLAGGVKTVRQLAEALQARGHRSTIAHLVDSRPWPRPWRARTWQRFAAEWRLLRHEAHHLEGISIPVIPVRRDRIRATDVPDADVVVGTWWETMEWIRGWPAAKGRPAYYVQHYEVHGGDPERVRATYRQPALKLVIAHWLKRLMAEEFGDPRAVLVPNGLDFDQFDAPPRGRQAHPTVGLMTSHKRWKRTDLAFEAIARVQRRLPDLRVVAFGSNPLTPGQAARRPAHLDFHLRPKQAELRGLYKGCDAWLLPSDLEGFGLPGLEAAACRCPVVATRCGGPEDYIEDGVSGFLVPVGDAGAMGERLEQLLRMPEPAWAAMGEAAHAVARTFTWERAAAIVEQALVAYVGQGRSALRAGRSAREEQSRGEESRRASPRGTSG